MQSERQKERHVTEADAVTRRVDGGNRDMGGGCEWNMRPPGGKKGCRVPVMIGWQSRARQVSQESHGWLLGEASGVGCKSTKAWGRREARGEHGGRSWHGRPR